MLKRIYSPKEVQEQLNITDKTLTSYADLVSEIVHDYAESTKRNHRMYNKKEIEVIRFMLRRKNEGLSKESARDEAVEIFYDNTELNEVLDKMQKLLNSLREN